MDLYEEYKINQLSFIILFEEIKWNQRVFP